MAETRKLRVNWYYDDDPDWSWLEQWDTPEKYYGGRPKCSGGMSMKYVEGHTWVCEREGNRDHDRHDHDCNEDHDHDDVDTCGNQDETVEYDGHGNKDGGQCVSEKRGLGEHHFVPFDDYKLFEGNPERHIVLVLTCEAQCGPCGAWELKDSLGGVDFHDTDRVVVESGITEEEIADKLDGYQRELAVEMCAEVRAQLKKEA